MFKVYSSSAGSGKTYTLTKEYLKLALSSESDTYFRSILAVTFTNAAANEMKERILLMLRIFSSPDGSTHFMLKDIVTELYPGIESDPELYQGTIELFAQRAKKIFRKILHRYSDFSVMTIDKFTQRLVSSFTDELGIPFAFETILETDQLSNAVDRMLARIGQEGEALLTDVVETYYRESAEGGKSWGSLPHRIREAAYDLLNEKSYLAMKKVDTLDVQDWVGISRQIKAFVRETEHSIQEQARQGFAAIQGKHLVAKDFYYSNTGIYGFFEKRAAGIDLWKEGNSYVRASISEAKWCGGKVSSFIQQEIDSISSVLVTCHREMANTLETAAQKGSLLRLIDKHLYNLSLLGEIRKEFDALLKQGNQVHISDFNRKVLEIVAREPVPFIFERLGEKYNHILVDEFQDTSKLQFANLLPLIDNALGFGNFNLIVGDAKQSIYRFRGGDMDLILHLSKNQFGSLSGVIGDNAFTEERLLSLERELDVAHLKTNRRSYREVTDFNNSFFSSVAGGEWAGDSELLSSVFDEHFQQEVTPDVKLGGHVQVEFLSESTADELEEQPTEGAEIMVSRTLELVDELRGQGYHWRDIAILCRRKSEAGSIAAALKERGDPLISDDSLLLTYSQTVNLLVSFMQVLQTPDDALARYEAAYHFHRIILEKIPNAAQHTAIREMCARRDTTSFLHYFEAFGMELNAFRLRQLGVYELCEKLINTFRLFEGLTEGPYLFRFLDAILEFGTRQSNHLADFLKYWETAQHKISITVPANADALRITTIHKSKGLEYPVVIVPNCDWSFTPSGNRDRIWVDLDAVNDAELLIEGLNDAQESITKRLNSSVVSMVKELDETILQADYQEEKNRTLLENLNLLYVAFTRPVQRLYVLARNPKDWNKCNDSVHRWLYDFLNSEKSSIPWDDGQSTYILSEGRGECRHKETGSDSTPYLLNGVISTDRTERLRLRRMAERIFDVDTFEKKKDRLQKLRYAMSLIATRADINKIIRQLISEGIVEGSEAEHLRISVERLLLNEPLASLFAEGATVRLKKELLLPRGKMLLADRLVTRPDGTEVLVNVVAGAGSDASRKQLSRALQAYQSMNRPDCKGLLVTLADSGTEWID
ncbi:UvrD-helicase domain-containing protein [Persicitalea jodogahamensis]|uniref:DNA 3'-5' helicase n=1 Tax=Persicitalea jodogahamensis TaxID=402147 RepID=A0A8J3D6C4_9BACT|nr:UvrD-helicase domain-containing protein [Persicitalea jodogahamensis]GHB81051.1 DNA helicase [Persicitalea jodogahamensis]